MTVKTCMYGNSSDWVTMIGDGTKPELLNKVFNVSSGRTANAELPPKQDGIESVYFCKNFASKSVNKHRKPKTKKHRDEVTRKSTGKVFLGGTRGKSTKSVYQRMADDYRPTNFKPYTSSCYQYNNLYKNNVMPKYLNGTIASEMKKVIPYRYWEFNRPTQNPFVTSVLTKNSHNVFILKQETFAKIKAAILPFRSYELNGQNINTLRSIKRCVERHWQL